MKSTLVFHGGVGTVTGANFLLDTGTQKILVDCGILQQEHVCDTANFEAFPFNPASIDVLLVTHAHADHIGRIPKLVKDGFKGVIYSTPATKDISGAMFDDALHIMQEDSVRHGCEVMYEREHIEKALSLWQVRDYHEPFALGDMQVTFSDSGHILGSALVRISRGGRSIVFTGDLGNSPEPVLRDTEHTEGVDYMVMESVYGDRVHEGRDGRKEALRAAVERARAAHGTLLIPSFSLERTQVLLFELNSMIEDGSMAPIPVYLDSPLAIRVTEIFRHYKDIMNADARAYFDRGDDPFQFKGLTITRDTAASKAIHEGSDPKIIIAGSGMSGGGRVRYHEREYLPKKNAEILFVGYQAPGSLGRRIQDGASHVTIEGQEVRVRARVSTLTGYSGHADRDQLLDFVEHAGAGLKRAFVTMGETRSSLFLAQRIRDFLGVDAVVPKKGESIDIEL